MWEKDFNNEESLRNFDLMSRSTTSNTGDVEKDIADMKKQILTLQSENSSLKRQIPRMKDMEGKDITENMKQLCDDLAKAEQDNEQWQNKYAESEQKLSRFQRKMQCELDTRDTQIAQLKACAKALEEDNERLKKKAENDLSKLYHLQNGADASDQRDLSLGAFEQSFGPDSVSQIKQDEKVKENEELTQQSDTRSVAEPSKEYDKTFRTRFNERRNKIKRTNDELAEEYRPDNAELAHQLNQLSNDSVFSSDAVHSQQRRITGADMLNRTLDVGQDLGAVIDRMNDLQMVCDQLFGKLRGTAEFLTSLLEHLEDSEDGRELLQKINEIKLDLEKSFGEAKFLVEQVKKAEKAVVGLRDVLQQTLDQSLEDNRFVRSEVSQNQGTAVNIVNESIKLQIERLKAVDEQCEALKSTLRNELGIKINLENKLAELKMQMEKNEAHFKQQLNELDAQLRNEKSRSLRIHRAIEEKDRAIDTFEKFEKEKSLAIAGLERNVAELKEKLRASNENLQSAQMQILELTKKCQSIMQFSKEQNMQIDDKVGLIAELEAELCAFRKQTQDYVGRKGQANVQMEKIIILGKENSDLRKENTEIKNKMEIISSKCDQRDAVLSKSNNLFYAKITKDLPDCEELDNVEGETNMKDKNESVACIEDLTSFLSDVRDRSNNLVQLVKKADKASAALGHNIPYLKNIFNETRAIRLILHKITNFFKSQKDNFKCIDVRLGENIILELKKIYEALESAVQSSQSDDVNAMQPVTREINYVRR